MPTPTPAPNGVVVTISQTSQWNGGFGANLEIANGGAPVNGWTLTFNFDQTIDSLWNGLLSRQGNVYSVRNESWNGGIPTGGKVMLGFNGSGTLAVTSATQCKFNGVPCTIQTVLGGGGNNGGGGGTQQGGIVIANVDTPAEAMQFTVNQGVSTFALSLRNQTQNGAFRVTTNNSTVVTARIVNNTSLEVTGLSAGRASLKIEETANNAVRFVGVRVRTSDGKLPGMPQYLSLATVSEDTDEHLSFLRSFEPGAKNKRVDARYIYLNGGPYNGWDTWSNVRGGRAINYIRESKKLGMIPFFVYYNIPDGGESYFTDLQHIQSATYMADYYKQLKFTLDILKTEAPDETVGFILEPDFLGYMAQNDGPASTIMAVTSAAYTSGVLTRGVDPEFPNTVQGLVRSINYIISKYAPQAYFGWQMNLWASPPGGFTTPVPGNGIIHKTDTVGVATGRQLVYNEAKAITQYYLDAGIGSYGAKFVSIDKYGLDAASAEASAAQNPAASIWFWNNDHWGNYLAFVRAMRDTTNLPVILWQLPVGHINSSLATNPYSATGTFPDLPNNFRKSEDSAPVYFFGDRFTTTGARFTHFSANGGNDPKLRVSGNTITWGDHMSEAAAAGVIMAMFGAGVGASTTNIGGPPTDDYWWITKAQAYYLNPVVLTIKP